MISITMWPEIPGNKGFVNLQAQCIDHIELPADSMTVDRLE